MTDLQNTALSTTLHMLLQIQSNSYTENLYLKGNQELEWDRFGNSKT